MYLRHATLSDDVCYCRQVTSAVCPHQDTVKLHWVRGALQLPAQSFGTVYNQTV